MIGSFALALVAAWGLPRLDRALNPGAATPGLISFLGTGLAVLAVTVVLFYAGLTRLLPRTALFVASALGYNALLIAVKLSLGPLALYAQNAYYREHSLPPGLNGNDPGFTFLTSALAYPGLAAIAAILYGGAFFLLYVVFHTRLQRRLGITVSFERRLVQLLVVMFVLAVVGGVTVIGLLGFLEYTLTIVNIGVVGVLIAVALLGAIALCSVAFHEAAEQAALVRNVALLSTLAWTGLAFIAAYHILWLVFLLTLVSIWPLKQFTFVSGVK
jgi:hypothetical protein